MLDNVVLELTKILIKQDIKDKSEGIEYIKMSKVDLINFVIKIIKYISKFK